MQSSMTLSQPWRPLLKVLGKSLAGLALATSIVGYGISGLPLVDSMAIASTLSRQVQQSLYPSNPALLPSLQSTLPESTQPIESSLSQPLSDGTYLYGQSTEAETVGSVYMVFDVKGRDVVGAFYMPHSSFDCFQGSFQANELALTIRDSYEQEEFPYSVALVSSGAIASEDVQSFDMGLEGFHPINAISENDQRILNTCRAEIW